MGKEDEMNGPWLPGKEPQEGKPTESVSFERMEANFEIFKAFRKRSKEGLLPRSFPLEDITPADVKIAKSLNMDIFAFMELKKSAKIMETRPSELGTIDPKTPEEILREALDNRATEEEKRKQEAIRKSEAKKAARREELYRVDRSEPADVRAFEVLDAIQTRDFLDAANKILYEGKGLVLPVQATDADVRVGYRKSDWSIAGGGGFTSTASGSKEYVTYNFFNLAGYILVSPGSAGPGEFQNNHTLYAGFVGKSYESGDAPKYEDFIIYKESNKRYVDLYGHKEFKGSDYVLDGYYGSRPFAKQGPLQGHKPKLEDGLDYYHSLPSIYAALTDRSKQPQAKKAFQEEMKKVI